MLKLPTMAKSSPQATLRYETLSGHLDLLGSHGCPHMSQDGTTAFTDAAATWNRRFEGDDFLFGAEPNEWLREHVAVWPPGGRILCVADGEGRNSVWLARQGFVVDAFDIAEVGVAKARRFAARQGVNVNYSVADCATYDWPRASLDGVAAIFIQFADPAQRERRFAARQGVKVNYSVADCATYDWPRASLDGVAAIFIQFADPAQRERLFAHMTDSLRPGGTLVLQGYTPKQLEYRTGGPPHASHLYTPELLRQAFSALEIIELKEYEADVAEGSGHRGRSALIGLVARRR